MDSPFLAEHEAPEKAGPGPEGVYSPTKEERETIKLVQDCLGKAKEWRKKYDEKWLDYYKMFRGKQWKENRPTYRHAEVINFVFRAIQSQVPVLTDIQPRIEYLPTEPTDFELSGILNDIVRSDWERGNWSQQLCEIIYDAHFYGTGLGELPVKDGAICFDSYDPFYFYPDPEARSVNKRCKYVVTAEPVDTSELKKDYPEHAKHLKPDLHDNLSDEKTFLNEYRYKSPTDQLVMIQDGQARDVKRERSLKVTLWIKPDEVISERVEEPGENGESKEFLEHRLKYPNGRKIVVSSGVLLEDGQIPYDDKMFPFARLVNYIDPRSFWGISDVEQIESPQRIFNKLVSFALDILTLTGNPIWVVDSTSGVDTENLFNRPGLIVEKEPNSEVRREPGMEVNSTVLAIIDRLKTWFDDVSGSQDVSRGVRPEGVTAASAIAALQETAQTRLRQKARHIDAFLQELGQLYLSRVFQFYSAPRVVRLTNNQGALKYFKFHVETLEDGSKVARIRDFVRNPDTDEINEDMDSRAYPIKGSFDVRVSTGSGLPFAKQEKLSTALNLFDRGLIDDEAVLKDADYPNWEAILARTQEKKAQAQAEQAQSAPPPQG